MSTYTKIKLGPITWQTNVDKELHMNPKWNEVRKNWKYGEKGVFLKK